jgi:hypothetical protein
MKEGQERTLKKTIELMTMETEEEKRRGAGKPLYDEEEIEFISFTENEGAQVHIERETILHMTAISAEAYAIKKSQVSDQENETRIQMWMFLNNIRQNVLAQGMESWL